MKLTREQLEKGAESIANDLADAVGTQFISIKDPDETGGWMAVLAQPYGKTSLKDSDVVLRALILRALEE